MTDRRTRRRRWRQLQAWTALLALTGLSYWANVTHFHAHTLEGYIFGGLPPAVAAVLLHFVLAELDAKADDPSLEEQWEETNWVQIGLLSFIASAAALTSFRALTAVGRNNGISPPQVMPLIIDGAAFSIGLVLFSMRKRARPVQKLSTVDSRKPAEQVVSIVSEPLSQVETPPELRVAAAEIPAPATITASVPDGRRKWTPEQMESVREEIRKAGRSVPSDTRIRQILKERKDATEVS